MAQENVAIVALVRKLRAGANTGTQRSVELLSCISRRADIALVVLLRDQILRQLAAASSLKDMKPILSGGADLTYL